MIISSIKFSIACFKATQSKYSFIGEIFRPEDKPFYFTIRSITNIAWNEDSAKLYQDLMSRYYKFDTQHSLYGQVISTGKTLYFK